MAGTITSRNGTAKIVDGGKVNNMELTNITNKYFEYKDILERIESGDHSVYSEVTVNQVEMMKNIVSTLEDQGFHLIYERKLHS